MLTVRWTDRAWFTVEDAAKILRVRRNTLYDACASGDFPCSRWGGSDGSWFIRIPAEALLLTPRPETHSRNWHVEDFGEHYNQYVFHFDVPIIPVRRYRNTREIIKTGDYECSLSTGRRWRNPDA